MAQFSMNQHRRDPYKNFKFQVVWDQKVVAGVSKVGALKRTTEVVSHREGGDPSTPRHSPGASKFEPITLERGITHAPEFREWAQLVYANDSFGDDAAMSLFKYKKDITIQVMNLQGSVVRAYQVVRCWVSSYTALPELDANANSIAFETIELQNEGFIDLLVPEIAEF